MVRVCVVGCLHGELDKVYRDIEAVDKEQGAKTQLILCCGDFQSLRNPADLHSMSVPTKFYAMGDFHRYYSEEVKAPILTVFVGGNHEASSYLQELPYGGWVAPNIWFMGYAGVVQFSGLRIAGLSGIYKQHDYSLGHFEHPPYSEATKRSVYHLRSLEVFRLGQLNRRVDIVLSHDWPRGIYHYGDAEGLCSRKRHFRDEVETNTLGSPPAEQLLCRLCPRYWFSAHLHCKFAAIVAHSDPQRELTKFLALDKCLPSRDYLQFLDIDPDPFPSTFSKESGFLTEPNENKAPVIVSQVENDEETPSLTLDPEWMCILKRTNNLLSVSQIPSILPGQDGQPTLSFAVTKADIESLWAPFDGVFLIPENFERTAPVYKQDDKATLKNKKSGLAKLAQEGARKQKQIFSNPQTELICAMLELTNPNAILMGRESYNLTELATRMGADEEATEDEDDFCCDTFVETPDTSILEPGNEIAGGYDPTDPSPLRKSCLNVPSPIVYENPEVISLDDYLDEEDELEKNPEVIIIDNIKEDQTSIASLEEYIPSTKETENNDKEKYNPTTTEVTNFDPGMVLNASPTEGVDFIAYKPTIAGDTKPIGMAYNPSVASIEVEDAEIAYHPRPIKPIDSIDIS